MHSIRGNIRRRILLNYAADATVVQQLLPEPFRPKLHNGSAVVGVCLIRLEQIRPLGLPAMCGISSDNAAHRIAVEWTNAGGAKHEGVYIPRRDTGSWLNYMAGGRLFPGEHHLARFDVEDAFDEISFAMKSKDGGANLDLKLRAVDELASGSIFSSVTEASQFFEGGCDGFSPRLRSDGVDGIRLCIGNWIVKPLEVFHANCTWFDNPAIFPKGTIRLDHALIMRDVSHEWQAVNSP